MKRLIIILMTMMLTTLNWAQGVKPLPSLHVEGKWLVDTHGNHVVLHGVMDTPNMYFNGWRWGSPWDGSNTGYNSTGATKCKNYFEKLFAGMEESKCTIFRLHMDPAWTNDPSDSYKYAGSEGQASDASGEADIKKFNPNRLKTYLKSVYFPLAQKAMNHGMYVVIRPPGVCPHNIKVGDYYNQYLMTVWDIFSQNDSIRKYAGQISIELANEPVNLKNAQGKDDAKALHDFFQPIVDKIRANGFTGIIWVPGTGYQSNYRSYKTNPVTGYNIGYAVHDYPGWYNSSDDNPGIANKRNSFHDAVPVVDTNPILISEVDWSPIKEPKEVDHYNEMGQPTYKNLGTWATASTSKWGKAYKAMLDYFGNISMTLTSTADYLDIDTLLNKKKVVASFGGNPEACAKACMDWYADYYTKDWAHADYQNYVVSDQGNGKYKNPVIAADFPDPDVVRVGDTYYMVSTTMHHFPGATIVKSKDLVNWQYCAQPLTQISTRDNYALLNGQDAYAKGMWACAMTYHEGKFYILLNCNDAGGFVLSASDPEGKWELKQLPRSYYDPGMLFDNGKVYVVCGINELRMCELDEDFNHIKDQVVVNGKDGLEGSHLYHIGDYYYIYATYGGWPSGQTVFRSKNIFGPYEEVEKMLVEKTINGQPNTIHQGALFDTPNGEWWTIMQEDLGCLGRMPNLQPVKWENDWPVVGKNGIPYTTYTKPDVGNSWPRDPMPTNDNFRTYPLGMQWQWNHNPDDGAWTLFERPGWLRLKTSGTADRLTQARNMLTQRIFAYEKKPSTGTVRIDVSHLQEGNRAGICILQDPYAMIAVEVKDGQRRLVWRQDTLRQNDNFTPSETTKKIQIDSVIYLRATVNYSTSKTQFYYSLDNQAYTKLGGQTTLGFNLSVFVGARFGLFCYATQETAERGYADFDWFSTEASFDEVNYFPATFEGYNQNMLTMESLTIENQEQEVMVGNNALLEIVATYRDGHTANVASQANYTVDNPSVVEISSGRIRGLGEGTSRVQANYTDPMGNEQSLTFTVRSTFFPFDKQYINTSLFSQGTYNEKTHTFRPGQYGQMGWEYPNGADFSDYKYLVIKLSATSSGSHLNIFTENSIWSPCYSTGDFGSKTQIVVNLQTAKYTSDGDKKGKALETKNIRIVCFWGNGAQDIKVKDIYLTNNSDYSPNSIDAVRLIPVSDGRVYDLQGRRVNSGALEKGVYIKDGKKIMIK
jgi:beta-xylosidase